MELREAFIDKNPKTYDYSEVLNKVRLFLSEVGKTILRGCLASLGNDGILECFCIKCQDLGPSLIIVIKVCIKSES